MQQRKQLHKQSELAILHTALGSCTYCPYVYQPPCCQHKLSKTLSEPDGIRVCIQEQEESAAHVLLVIRHGVLTGLHGMQRQSGLLTGQPCWRPGESATGPR